MNSRAQRDLDQLTGTFSRVKLDSGAQARALEDFERHLNCKPSAKAVLTYEDILKLGTKNARVEILKPGTKEEREDYSVVSGNVYGYLIYLKDKREIIEVYQESHSWETVFNTAVYRDSPTSMEGFTDFVGETYQTEVESANNLQRLTGISVDLLDELEDTIYEAKQSRYQRAVSVAIGNGAKYQDLLKIMPQQYGLPDVKENKSVQGKAITMGISFEYGLMESVFFSPSLREVAKDMEAPYSVIMDCIQY